MFIVAVYVPPQANANAALKELHDSISTLQNNNSEALYVVVGDFNHVDLHAKLPMFHKHVTIATRGDNTLNKVYTNRQEIYRAIPRPHLAAARLI